MGDGRPVAFVTGASRGIGRATAIDLAAAGYDVGVAARTMTDGTARLDEDPAVAVPGGLDTTVASVEKHGVDGFAVAMDLLDRSSVMAAVDAAQQRFGRIDVLVNNAIYQGPGVMAPFDDLTDDELHRIFEGNVLAQLALVRAVLPAMLERGEGTIVNLISQVAFMDPPAKLGAGGWGLGYAMSKAAFARVAPLLHVEYGDRGVHFYNVQPGFVTTERMVMDMAEFGFDASTGAPPAMVGAVVVWLVREHAAPNGSNIEAQETCSELNLLPGWSMPAT